MSLLSENVRRVLSENVRSMYPRPRALDAAAMNVRADRRRKNKSSSVRLAILAVASRVRCAALRNWSDKKQSLPKEEQHSTLRRLSSRQRDKRCAGGGPEDQVA